MQESKIKLSIIIPCYNEKNTILTLIERVKKTPYDKEIIIVDDNSTDGTKELLKKIASPSIKILYHNKNKGKGNAIQTTEIQFGWGLWTPPPPVISAISEICVIPDILQISTISGFCDASPPVKLISC